MASAKSLVVQSVTSPLNLKIEGRRIPVAGPGTAIVEILATSIAPTYGYLLSHPIPYFEFPVPSVYGNNAIGRVISTGVDSTSLKPGQLVFVDSFITARDDPDTEMLLGLMDGGTENSKKLANEAWRDGYWQTHATVPLENATLLNEEYLLGELGCEPAELTYLNRFAVAYGAVSTVDIKAGETVIVGPATGQFGGAGVEVAAALGARVIALGRNTETLSRLQATIPRVKTVVLTGDVGKDTQAILAFGPADVFIDFSPHTMSTEPSHIRSAIQALRRRGRVVLMGGFGGEISIPYFHVMQNSINIKGRWMYSRKELRTMIKMVETGLLKIGKFSGHKVSGKFTLDEWKTALDAASKHPAWGDQIVFKPSG
ncbi:NAD(P)-binding protein [Whalleya microplaca]|nr:NAD(P)-binding protein [Whalleya microplaca]